MTQKQIPVLIVGGSLGGPVRGGFPALVRSRARSSNAIRARIRTSGRPATTPVLSSCSGRSAPRADCRRGAALGADTERRIRPDGASPAGCSTALTCLPPPT